MMIRLFTSAFPEPDSRRMKEFAECLSRNLGCGAIDEVCLMVEGGAGPPGAVKLRQRAVTARPTYADYFDWISEVAAADDVSILANADIWFDESMGVLRSWSIPGRTALALSRWEIRESGARELNDRNDSQDAWIFRGPVLGVAADFHVGAVRCDNRVAKELQLAGYDVLNPSFAIRAWHLHAGGERDYDVAHRPEFVPPPYAYVWPHNLLSLPRTLAHNFAHPESRIGWRIDTRRVRSALKVHRVEKGMRMILSAAGLGKERN